MTLFKGSVNGGKEGEPKGGPDEGLVPCLSCGSPIVPETRHCPICGTPDPGKENRDEAADPTPPPGFTPPGPVKKGKAPAAPTPDPAAPAGQPVPETGSVTTSGHDELAQRLGKVEGEQEELRRQRNEALQEKEALAKKEAEARADLQKKEAEVKKLTSDKAATQQTKDVLQTKVKELQEKVTKYDQAQKGHASKVQQLEEAIKEKDGELQELKAANDSIPLTEAIKEREAAESARASRTQRDQTLEEANRLQEAKTRQELDRKLGTLPLRPDEAAMQAHTLTRFNREDRREDAWERREAERERREADYERRRLEIERAREDREAAMQKRQLEIEEARAKREAEFERRKLELEEKRLQLELKSIEGHGGSKDSEVVALLKEQIAKMERDRDEERRQREAEARDNRIYALVENQGELIASTQAQVDAILRGDVGGTGVGGLAARLEKAKKEFEALRDMFGSSDKLTPIEERKLAQVDAGIAALTNMGNQLANAAMGPAARQQYRPQARPAKPVSQGAAPAAGWQPPAGESALSDDQFKEAAPRWFDAQPGAQVPEPTMFDIGCAVLPPKYAAQAEAAFQEAGIVYTKHRGYIITHARDKAKVETVVAKL